jgi:hypothetical protein
MANHEWGGSGWTRHGHRVGEAGVAWTQAGGARRAVRGRLGALVRLWHGVGFGTTKEKGAWVSVLGKVGRIRWSRVRG